MRIELIAQQAEKDGLDQGSRSRHPPRAVAPRAAAAGSRAEIPEGPHADRGGAARRVRGADRFRAAGRIPGPAHPGEQRGRREEDHRAAQVRQRFRDAGEALSRPTRNRRSKRWRARLVRPARHGPAVHQRRRAAQERRIHRDAGADAVRLARDPAAEHARPHAACFRRRQGSPYADRGREEIQDALGRDAEDRQDRPAAGGAARPRRCPPRRRRRRHPRPHPQTRHARQQPPVYSARGRRLFRFQDLIERGFVEDPARRAIAPWRAWNPRPRPPRGNSSSSRRCPTPWRRARAERPQLPHAAGPPACR